jgi:hypothetical protein
MLLKNVKQVFARFLHGNRPSGNADAGETHLFADEDKIIKSKDDAGTVMQMVPEAVSGDSGKFLKNNSGVLEYASVPSGIPGGGTTGQVLAKVDNTDGNVHWVNQATGGPADASELDCTDPTTAAAGNVQYALDNLFQYANDGKAGVADAIGSGEAAGSDTFATLAGYITTDKGTMAANLTAKGVTASGTETLAALAAKIASISQEGGGTPEKFINPTTLTIPSPPTISVGTAIAAI